MRIAWLGPTPSEHGGVPYVATQLLRELARADVQVDCFVVADESGLPPSLLAEPGLRFFCRPSRWKWDRWYSRTPMRAFFSGSLQRLTMQFQLAELLAHQHRSNPYDLVYQFSQSETVALRRIRRQLPPIVLQPETHAAGELAWHRREDELSRRCEPLLKRVVVRGVLRARAAVQAREVRQADRVLAVSRRFADHLARDYRVPPARLGIVPNPIDLQRFSPSPNGAGPSDCLSVLFVSRMSTRKGVEMVVALSHRLGDLQGKVRIRAVGGATTWSDYRPLLRDLDQTVATFDGNLSPAALASLYRTSDALIQPSLYEPFALTVGEGLASGLPVVASDEVGAGEGVNPAVCRVFPAGDLDAFEAAVRDLVARLQDGDIGPVRQLARAEAERLFAPSHVASALIGELESVIRPTV
jgi:glycosyltransferase involved in cell wall biosynthesis